MQGKLSLGIKLHSSYYIYACGPMLEQLVAMPIWRLLLHGNKTSWFTSLAFKTHGKTKMRLHENQDN